MMKTSDGKQNEPIAMRSLIPFFLIAFGLAWGILTLYIVFTDTMSRLFGELTGEHPLFFLAVWAPAISAFIIIFIKAGFSGFRGYLSRLLLWRCPLSWYLFLLLGIPMVFLAGSALKGNLDETFPFPSAASFLSALLLMAIKGPIEEFGWRGFALPLLQRKLAPVWAGLVLGIIWGFWHLPAFLLSGTPQSAWSFTPFFIGSVALSVIVTPLFNTSGGSILLPALFHFLIINPAWADAQPYDTYLFCGVAVLVVWLNRKTLFTKEESVRRVVPGR